MRAVVVTEFGGPEALKVIETPVPTPGPGEVLIRVKAAGVNPTDMMARVGAYVQAGVAIAADQYGAGVDVAGTVESVGDGVYAIAVGMK